MASALILDCDGVIADTEQFGHLVAFNQTFREFGLPVQWSVADYREKLLIGGGKERMASLLTPEFIAAASTPGLFSIPPANWSPCARMSAATMPSTSSSAGPYSKSARPCTGTSHF